MLDLWLPCSHTLAVIGVLDSIVNFVRFSVLVLSDLQYGLMVTFARARYFLTVCVFNVNWSLMYVSMVLCPSEVLKWRA